ncbi:hypothetical protein [Rhodopirellula europaea]|uniref:hypothetical protein n=1 Tax=Rhodopirellula europaea TaxID=1263866 RepID=UPI003D26FFFA
MSDLFFPQRIELRLDGTDYSPAVLERIVTVGGSSKSFAIAAKMFELLTDLKVSQRTINNKTIAIGCELKAARDAVTDEHLARPIPQTPKVAQPAVSLAVAQVDGGRMQTRSINHGSGVHDPHWRESKNAGLFRMTGKTFRSDPHPQLPSCFASPKQMAGLLHGTGDLPQVDVAKPDLSWRPKSLVRTCLSSLCNSDRFGEMMSAEAEQRGFYSALAKAFLGDGLAYNWKIQQTHFESFTPILDFIHPIERLHELSRVLFEDAGEAWQHGGKWIELCWQGDVAEVIGILQAEQLDRGEATQTMSEDDPRVKLGETIGYLQNNVSRMNYPAYREAGLPTTSCLIESQVKEINHRVKGTEKFWNDGASGDAILHLRAALISDSDELSNHMSNRPGRQYTRQSKQDRQLAAT